MKKGFILILFFFISGLLQPINSAAKSPSTASIPVVQDFCLERYLGTWYEIARLPNSMENNLDQVTFTHTKRADGEIEIINRGFDSEEGCWKRTKAIAWIPDESVPAFMRIRIYFIIRGDYKIIHLDTDSYSYAMVTSRKKKYLWILSRTPQMDETVYEDLVRKAGALGFKVDKLYRVPHSSAQP